MRAKASEELKISVTTEMGMEIKLFEYKSVIGSFAEGDDWLTLYHVQSKNPGNGEAQEALIKLREYAGEKKFGSTVALNSAMDHILKKLGIEQYI